MDSAGVERPHPSDEHPADSGPATAAFEEVLLREGEDTRALPMTLFSPMSRPRARISRILGWLNMRGLKLTTRFYPWGRLIRLSFIHFAHWSVVYRIPPNDPKGRFLPHPYLIFQTNFNRGWREYVEAFCYVVRFGVRVNWTGAYGFPSPRRVTTFLDYVDERFTEAAHFYCAYPDSSTRMVLTALDERRRFNDFAADNYEPPARFLRRGWLSRAPRGRALGGYQGSPETRSRCSARSSPAVSTRCQSCCARSRTARTTTRRAPCGASRALTWRAGRSSTRSRSRTPAAPSTTSYLLFTSWFEGDISAYIRELRNSLETPSGEDGPSLTDQIWGNCVAYPGCKDQTEFYAYLMLHRIKPHLIFGGYSDTVTEVDASRELRTALEPEIIEKAGLSTVELRGGETGAAGRWRGHPDEDGSAGCAPEPNESAMPLPWKKYHVDQQDLQGNLLAGYGNCYPHASYYFLVFKDPATGRQWLGALADKVTTAVPWTPETRPAYTVNVSLTRNGLRALGLPEPLLGTFPTTSSRA